MVLLNDISQIILIPGTKKPLNFNVKRLFRTIQIVN